MMKCHIVRADIPLMSLLDALRTFGLQLDFKKHLIYSADPDSMEYAHNICIRKHLLSICVLSQYRSIPTSKTCGDRKQIYYEDAPGLDALQNQ